VVPAAVVETLAESGGGVVEDPDDATGVDVPVADEAAGSVAEDFVVAVPGEAGEAVPGVAAAVADEAVEALPPTADGRNDRRP